MQIRPGRVPEERRKGEQSCVDEKEEERVKGELIKKKGRIETIRKKGRRKGRQEERN